jgi:hypothetical protein
LNANNDKSIPTIKEYVYRARKTDSRIPLQWKNNNCEAMNHIFVYNVSSEFGKLDFIAFTKAFSSSEPITKLFTLKSVSDIVVSS